MNNKEISKYVIGKLVKDSLRSFEAKDKQTGQQLIVKVFSTKGEDRLSSEQLAKMISLKSKTNPFIVQIKDIV